MFALTPEPVQSFEPDSTQTRISALDRLRVIANFGRLMIHAAVPYMVTHTGMWPLYDKQNSRLFDAMVYMTHSFVNELFFVLCGFFALKTMEKYGVRGFLRNRAQKILLPFLIGLAVLIPMIISCFSFVNLFTGSTPELFQWNRLIEANLTFIRTYSYPLGNLWFLYYLLMCYVVWVLGRTLLRKTIVRFRLSDRIALAICLAISTSMLLCMHSWHRDTPLFFSIQWPVFIYFLICFLFGVALAKTARLIEMCRLHHRRLLLTGLLLTCVGLPLQMQYPNHSLPLYVWIRAAAIFVFSVQSFAFVFGFIGLSYSLTSVHRPWVSNLAKASYWTSYIELPVVMGAHIFLDSFSISIFIKYFITVVFALLTSLITFRYIVSPTFLNHFFGTYTVKASINS
jgi:glucan biosynthesis protein C